MRVREHILKSGKKWHAFHVSIFKRQTGGSTQSNDNSRCIESKDVYVEKRDLKRVLVTFKADLYVYEYFVSSTLHYCSI